jgi:hypothetical protein
LKRAIYRAALAHVAVAVALAAAAPACGRSGDAPPAPARGAKTPPPPAPAPAPAAAPDAAAALAPPAGPLPPHASYPTAREALAALLAQAHPRVLGVGEAHVVAGGPPVRSALSRFSDDMLDVLGGRATDLLVETWVTDGRCGGAEKRATAAVRADTARPPETESEIERLLRRGRELGMRPHVLRLRCADYQALRGAGADVDYDRLLRLIGRELHAGVRAALRADRHAAVVVYGGSLHNDRAPQQSVAAYSYGVELAREIGAGYVELDLYAPELIASDQVLAAEPWYPLVAQTGADHVLLIRGGEGSWVLLLPRTVRKR